VEDVKTADVTFDYTSTKVGDAPAPEQFAWSPPRDATVAKEEVPEESAGAATALEGKPAPDFKLTAIDGSSVSLADLKDHVVVLDFWATWCGPCVASIPHIDQINADLSDKGLKVFAVNLQEPKPLVQKFVVSKKLTLPVLLDTDGVTGKKYLANAIPETVIIGKDGVVKKVFVGFGGDEALRAAIDAEMKK
jgi:thiol-disulfide isomerase/thioredoxin